MAFELRDALSKQADVLHNDRQSEVEKLTDRHEKIIKMLIESHKNEVFLMREKIQTELKRRVTENESAEKLKEKEFKQKAMIKYQS